MKIILSFFIFTLLFTVTSAQRDFPEHRLLGEEKSPEYTSGINPLQLGSEGINEKPQPIQFRNMESMQKLTDIERNQLPEDRLEARQGNIDLRENREEIIQGGIELRERRMGIEQDKPELKKDRVHIREEMHERVYGLLKGITNKFTNAISRLDNIEERLSTILNGNDSDIQSMVDSAIELKEVAKNSVEELNTTLEEELSNEEGVSKEIIRELIQKTQIDIKNAWNAFREIITEIKSSETETSEEETNNEVEDEEGSEE